MAMSLPVDDDLAYKIASQPYKGLCVIIVNKHFWDVETKVKNEKKTRHGCEHDRRALIETFTALGFLVKPYDDLTDTEMISVMKEVSNYPSYSMKKTTDDPGMLHYDCFVCCFSSHGEKGTVLGSNGIYVNIKDLTQLLKNHYCAALSGKPKMFFIQACQGSQTQAGVLAADAIAETDAVSDEVRLIPSESDFLVGYSTVPGYVSYRDKKKGSYYIHHLTQCLTTYAGIKHVVDIHTIVNKRVGDESFKHGGKGRKMTPYFKCTLQRTLHLFPTTGKEELPSSESENVPVVSQKEQTSTKTVLSMKALAAPLPKIEEKQLQPNSESVFQLFRKIVPERGSSIAK